MTDGCTLLVGYNTASEMPPLPGRTVLVDDRGLDNDVSHIDWCIGGKKTYEKYQHLFTELHVSVIDNETIGDTEYPNFFKLNPDCKVIKYNFAENKPK
jgi:dihydrofolate reductase